MSGSWQESSRSALLGLTIGNLAGPNSAPATVNMIYMPLAFCGGLWIPFDFLPKAIQQIAPLLPSYHLGQIALADPERAR